VTQGFTLRPYQQQAVDATLAHFRQSDASALLVLPTGAGKSLVIAELARLAKRKILVVTHVQELVEQNAAKFLATGRQPGIYSAGLRARDTQHQVVFGSIQSIAANLTEFANQYSLVIIDEAHRVSDDTGSQYQQLIEHLRQSNPELKVLGLTATPYRLGYGWIYRFDYRGFVRSEAPRIFEHCIFDLPLRLLIKQGFLTPPVLEKPAIAHYDFSSLQANRDGLYAEADLNALLSRFPRVTQAICEQLTELSKTRRGVMIFAASVKHAIEIASYLPADKTAVVIANTSALERDLTIQRFKAGELLFLVNVAVLTTGFDAPHVDLIALLRPTQSVSLFQQMVGRGLRLAEGKRNCLVIDYANNGIDLFDPEVGEPKPASDTEPVQVFCPECGQANLFWGRTDSNGLVTEHFGRRCQGLLDSGLQCSFRFKFKRCGGCASENDIAARNCWQCDMALIDPDELIKRALSLKDHKVIRCSGISLTQERDAIRVTYHDEDGNTLSERFDMRQPKQQAVFNRLFGRRNDAGQRPASFSSNQAVLAAAPYLPHPDFVVSRKQGKFWRITERLFDYQGPYRRANEL